MKKSFVKKLLAVSVLASLVLTGCGKASAEKKTSDSATSTEVSTEASTETPAQASADGVRKIVVSHSAASWPYNVLTADGESDGYEVAVLKAVDELLPQYEFVFEAPPSRCRSATLTTASISSS